jgi:hypothetical protein
MSSIARIPYRALVEIFIDINALPINICYINNYYFSRFYRHQQLYLIEGIRFPANNDAG